MKKLSSAQIHKNHLTLILLLLSTIALFVISLFKNLNIGGDSIPLVKEESRFCGREGEYYDLQKALKESEKVCFLKLVNLSELPQEINKLKNLRELHINATNHIKTLPSEIGELHNLRVLDLMFNENLNEVPMEIYRLNNLEQLLLTNNKLEHLPKGISALKKLKVLRLDNNNLMCLPSGIVELYNLEDLRLGGNNLVMLPPGIERLKTLKVLSVYHNPLVLDQTPQDFLSARYHGEDAKVWKEEIAIFKKSAEKGEGITHLARKIIDDYLSKIDFPETNLLTDQEKICLEDHLQNKTGYERLLFGETRTFSATLLKEAFGVCNIKIKNICQ